MRAKRVVGRDRFRHQIGTLRRDAVVDMLAEIGIGPAVERTVANRSDVVRHEVAAELVACGSLEMGADNPEDARRVA